MPQLSISTARCMVWKGTPVDRIHRAFDNPAGLADADQISFLLLAGDPWSGGWRHKLPPVLIAGSEACHPTGPVQISTQPERIQSLLIHRLPAMKLRSSTCR